MQYHEFDQIQQIVVIKRHVLNQITYQLGRNFLVRIPLIKNTPFERARKTESNDLIFTKGYSQVPNKNF
jgi:hypothetical protein